MSDLFNQALLRIKQHRLGACNRARGAVNRLPIAQRSAHYSNINRFQNTLRADIKRLKK